MDKFLTRLPFAFAVILLPLFGGVAEACSCGPIPSPYQAHRESRAVFIGKATSSVDVPFKEMVRDREYTYHERRFRFAVEESFKGEAKEIEVSAGRVDSMCYTGFTVGESYLVYADGDSDTALYSLMCSRTRSVEWVLDEVHILRALRKGEPEPRVYGAVTRVDNDPAKGQTHVPIPVEGIRIEIEGEGQRFEAVTDEHGRYSLSKVPDGRYKARPLLPDKYRYYTEQEFILGTSAQTNYPAVPQGAGAYVAFTISWNNEIGGRILDAEGNPVKRAKAALFRLRDSSEAPFLVQESHSDMAEGKYRFGGLTPGRYLPSVNIEAPFKTGEQQKRFYHPGAASPGQANEIKIEESGSLSGKDIKLPPGHAVRQIEGVMVWPDGSPVKGWAALAGKERLGENEKVFDGGSADEQGRFSLEGFVGAEYWLHVSVGTYGMKTASGKDLWESGVQRLSARPVKVTPGKVNEPLRVIIPIPEGVNVNKER